MKRLRAVIRESNRKAMHIQGYSAPDGIQISTMPEPATLEIMEQDGAYYLFRLDECGQCISDTWHMSLVEAKEQAIFEFKLEQGGWKEVDDS